MDLNDLFLTNAIVSMGIERFYCVNLNERRWDLEFSTPVFLFIEDEFIKCRSWVHMIKALGIYLQTNHPLPFERLFDYRTDWSKAEIYSDHEFIKNVVKLEDNLFLSVNYTALHSSWIIADLLKLYNIDLDNCLLVVHKSPKAEPDIIRTAIETYVKDEFVNFLIEEKKKTEESAIKIAKTIKLMNKVLELKNTSYNNFFLFDNCQLLSNCKSTFIKDSSKFFSWNENQINTVKKYLNYLTDFYSYLTAKIEKKEREESKMLVFVKPNGFSIKLKSAKKV